MKHKCKNCLTSTKNPKFCSRKCSVSFNNAKTPKRLKKPKICKKCQSEYFKCETNKSNNYCSKCTITRVRYKKMSILEYKELSPLTKQHPSWLWSAIRTLGRRWNKELLTKPCANCSYKPHVELCHIQGITTFPEDTTLEEIHSEKNVIQLCRNCHWEFDHDFLLLKVDGKVKSRSSRES